ncbi:MAG: 2-amino-4-hydroxy-6-hydroxymethyldihydropteridine diphosphokinase [Caldilineales bacterium]|nr:2-amino-4-hydroxy-6-hydroxymethyldihydropteridine diphosphokinase [Caldilineales bacterium]
MPTVYLALGANLGDRGQNLAEAIGWLGQVIAITQVSPIYETAPWGVLDQPDFLNQVIAGSTDLTPFALLAATQATEQAMGRQPHGPRYGPRLIDIDMLFYGALTFASYALTLPHPRLVERSFVLQPLADIAPDLVHPGLGCTVATLWARVRGR